MTMNLSAHLLQYKFCPPPFALDMISSSTQQSTISLGWWQAWLSGLRLLSQQVRMLPVSVIVSMDWMMILCPVLSYQYLPPYSHPLALDMISSMHYIIIQCIHPPPRPSHPVATNQSPSPHPHNTQSTQQSTNILTPLGLGYDIIHALHYHPMHPSTSSTKSPPIQGPWCQSTYNDNDSSI